GIVLEGHEGKVREALMSFEVIEESAEPRVAAARVFPNLDVFRDSLEDGASEFQFWIDGVERFGPLQIQRAIVFRNHVLAVGFLTLFYIGNRITAFLDVCNFR